MKSLEEEAVEYANKILEEDHPSIFGNFYSLAETFVAGANSKYVQAEKIKAQIEILQWSIESEDPEVLLESCKQRLKELQDE